MAASWNDIENAVKNNTIESLDKATLEEFSKIAPPNNNNPGPIALCQNAQQRIFRRLEQIRADEQEQREAARLATSIRWSRIAAIAVIAGVVLMFMQILLSTCQTNR